MTGVQFQPPRAAPISGHTERPENLEQGENIPAAWHILDDGLVLRQSRRDDYREGAVFGPGNANPPGEPSAPLDQESFCAGVSGDLSESQRGSLPG